MNLAQALSTYLSLNVLLLVGFASLAVLSAALGKVGARLSSGQELKLHYFATLAVLGLTAVRPLLPRNESFSPPAKVWSARSIESFGEDAAPGKGGVLSFPTPIGASTVQAERLAAVWTVLGGALLALGVALIARDLRLLLRIKRRSVLVRQVGRARVLVNDDVSVPFSFWLPGEANVVLPSEIVGRRDGRRMAIAHELQHHRQGDTKWVYVMRGLKWACPLNPAVHLWNRWVSEIQEFACDEALVDRKKVESQAYARCLVEAAQTAIERKRAPVCATGFVLPLERKLLHRRIEKMLSNSSANLGRSIGIAIGVAVASILGAAAYASNGLVQDRRVSLTQAKDMALRAQSEGGFPVVVNDRVLKQLNRYLGTPEGREFMRDSLARMEAYRSVVSEHLRKYGAPSELMAVPIVESGYRNLPEPSGAAVKAAGIWQFIPQTARNYGLRVDAREDERLDATLLTDAAMRYLQANNLRFRDWQLAVLSYNMGEDAVQKGMNALGTRDAWELVRNGYEGDKDYLPKLMAAILIMRNPDSVR